MRSSLLILLLFALAACAAPNPGTVSPTMTAPIPVSTGEVSKEAPTLAPESTATIEPYNFAKFEVKDKTTWPAEQQSNYESFGKRPTEAADAPTQGQFKKADNDFHMFLMPALVNFLGRNGVDMSAYTGENVEFMNLEVTNGIIEKFGEWQKANFDATGEMVLMPTDLWAMKEMLKIDATNAGGSTNKVSFFGESIKIEGLMEKSENFTISTIMENPTNSNTSILIVQCVNGTRPLLVNFNDEIIDVDNLVVAPPNFLENTVITVKGINDLRAKVDLIEFKLILRATDGTDQMHETDGLNIKTIFSLLGENVIGYQVDRINAADHPEGLVVPFSSLFDNKTGLGVLSGISHSDGTPINPY